MPPEEEEERFLARLAAHPSAGEEPGDSEETFEAILDVGRVRIVKSASGKRGE